MATWRVRLSNASQESNMQWRDFYSQKVSNVVKFTEKLKVYANNCLKPSNVYKWIEHFKSGRLWWATKRTTGRSCDIHPRIFKAQTGALMRDNRRITVEMIGKGLHASIGIAQNVIQNMLQCKKTCTRWVPRRYRTQAFNSIEKNTEETVFCFFFK